MRVRRLGALAAAALLTTALALSPAVARAGHAHAGPAHETAPRGTAMRRALGQFYRAMVRRDLATPATSSTMNGFVVGRLVSSPDHGLNLTVGETSGHEHHHTGSRIVARLRGLVSSLRHLPTTLRKLPGKTWDGLTLKTWPSMRGLGITAGVAAGTMSILGGATEEFVEHVLMGMPVCPAEMGFNPGWSSGPFLARRAGMAGKLLFARNMGGPLDRLKAVAREPFTRRPRVIDANGKSLSYGKASKRAAEALETGSPQVGTLAQLAGPLVAPQLRGKPVTGTSASNLGGFLAGQISSARSPRERAAAARGISADLDAQLSLLNEAIVTTKQEKTVGGAQARWLANQLGRLMDTGNRLDRELMVAGLMPDRSFNRVRPDGSTVGERKIAAFGQIIEHLGKAQAALLGGLDTDWRSLTVDQVARSRRAVVSAVDEARRVYRDQLR